MWPTSNYRVHSHPIKYGFLFIGYHDGNLTVQKRIHKSLKLWMLYADLQESLGTFESCRSVYDRILELRIANPQVILNFGTFLEENNYYEQAFTAYERGIGLFKWPIVFEIWDVYLVKFVKRFGMSISKHLCVCG